MVLRSNTLLAFTAIILFCAALNSCSNGDRTAAVQQTRDSVVSLRLRYSSGKQFGQRNYGTGFFVSESLIATALHVVKALETDKSSYHEGYLNISAEKYTPTNDFAFSISVKVVAIDEVNDLALLSFDPAEIATQWKQFRVKPLKLSTSLPQIGDDVLLTGFLGNDIDPFTSIGTVAVVPSKSSDQDFPVMNEPIYSDLTSIPGFSGGPLFSIQRGEVVGVSIRILYPNKDYVRGSVAVNSLRLRELLEKANAN